MSCIHCYSQPLHLYTLQRHKQNAKLHNKHFCHFFGSSKNRHFSVATSQDGVFALKVEAFPTIALATAKPPDTSVLIQTSALLIFVYLIANFVVPQFISKSFESDEEDEKEKNNKDSMDDQKTSSMTEKRGFNSTKPK